MVRVDQFQGEPERPLTPEVRRLLGQLDQRIINGDTDLFAAQTALEEAIEEFRAVYALLSIPDVDSGLDKNS